MRHRSLAFWVAFTLLIGLALPIVARAEDPTPPGPRAGARPGSAVVLPPKIPHDLATRQYCTMCHKVGGVGVQANGGIGMPADHEGRQDDVCTGCHLPLRPQARTAGLASAAITTTTSGVLTTTAASGALTTVTVQVQAPPAVTTTVTGTVPLTSTGAMTGSAATALPSAGEPLVDASRVWWLSLAGALLLVGAIAIQRLLARP